MKTLLASSLLFVLTVSAGADPGLIAHWTFDEGRGDLLKDAVSGIQGKIRGATWVPSGTGHALRFDGLDDHVEFGSPAALSPSDAITVEAWLYPEKVPSAGEPGIVGKAYANYVLTYYRDGKCWWYSGQTGTNAKASVSPGRWHHVVGTYDGAHLTLYVDGEVGDRRPARTGKIPAGAGFHFGKSEGDVQWTQNAHFAGMIDEVRVYSRALTPEEVREHYRTTRLTMTPEVTAFIYHANREVCVQVGLRGFGELPGGCRVLAEVRRAGQERPLATARVDSPESWLSVEVALKSPRFTPGPHRITAWVVDASGKRIGQAAETEVEWPAMPAWEVKDPRIKVLNSLVSELRRVRRLSRPATVVDFTNPRDGWVFFRATSRLGAGGKVTVTLPEAGPAVGAKHSQEDASRTGRPRGECFALTAGGPATVEAMRRLPAGRHEIRVECSDGARVEDLVIRAIPEIGYCRVDAGPQIRPYGPCDWEFLKEHVLPHINLAVSRGVETERAQWEEWKRQGKRWIVETPLVGLGKRDGVTADEVEQAWVERGRLEEPLLDGIIVDEFSAGNDPIWASWHEAVKRIRDNPKYAGKLYYPYCAPLHGAAASQAFAQTVMDAGWAVAFERYLYEEPTEAAARAALNTLVVQAAKDWEAAQPGIVRRMLVVWGFFISAPNETTNINPGVDLKAFTDMQMHVLANDPTFFGLHGVTSYLSAYSDEETIRWYARLCRHYCIEGRTDRLTETYNLRHVENPDFAEGLKGWDVSPAEEGSIGTGTAEGLSWLQGRYPPTPMGNTYLLLRRGAKGPNQVRQAIRDLVPGRLYSAKLISSDRGEYLKGKSTKVEHALRLVVEGAEVLPVKSFRFPFGSCYSHHFEQFNRDNPYYMNLHQVLFRAKAKEARLTIVDWEKPDAPGGPIGQELMCNFVEVQPYLE